MNGQSVTGIDRSGYFWDHESCPLGWCDGDLEQQDRFNVMCLSCERAWGHMKDEDYHYLVGSNGESVTKKNRTLQPATDR